MRFQPSKLSYHFSVDDVFNSLIEVSDQNMPLFSHPFFNFVNNLHKQFNMNIDLYCFYQREIDGKMRSLQDVSSRIQRIIRKNPWLRFGPHALDYDHPPYAQKPDTMINTCESIYSEIRRFAGENNFSFLVRLHYFSELYELAEYLNSKGVKALLSTDKKVLSHRMPIKIKDSLGKKGVASYQGMTFVRTHFRVENLINLRLSDEQINRFLENFLDKYGFIIFFTHEYDVPRPGIKPAAIRLLNKCINLKLSSI